MTIKVKNFMCRSQLAALRSGLQGEEKTYFSRLILDTKKTLEDMPVSYETQSDENPTVHLHYFLGGMDWYIIELDKGDPEDKTPGIQHQAFGLADLGHGGELGYISIQELIDNNIEMDLHWKPTRLQTIQEQHGPVR